METKPAKIRFAGIELLSKYMSERPDNTVIPPNDFHFDIISESQVNPSEKLIIIKTNIKVNVKDSSSHCFAIVLGCAFFVENFNEIVFKSSSENNIYKIPLDLDAILKSMALSTTRGVIYSEVKGTFLLNMILPIMVFTPEQLKEKSEVAEKDIVKNGDI